jgi:hypothetical protein
MDKNILVSFQGNLRNSPVSSGRNKKDQHDRLAAAQHVEATDIGDATRSRSAAS